MFDDVNFDFDRQTLDLLDRYRGRSRGPLSPVDIAARDAVLDQANASSAIENQALEPSDLAFNKALIRLNLSEADEQACLTDHVMMGLNAADHVG